MKPSDFQNASTMGSVFRKSEHETVARNVMKILSRTGDTFRLLSWDEYKAERQKDGNFSEREYRFFDDVVNYCASSHGAAAFCSGWAKVAMEYNQHPSQKVLDLLAQDAIEDVFSDARDTSEDIIKRLEVIQKDVEQKIKWLKRKIKVESEQKHGSYRAAKETP